MRLVSAGLARRTVFQIVLGYAVVFATAVSLIHPVLARDLEEVSSRFYEYPVPNLTIQDANGDLIYRRTGFVPINLEHVRDPVVQVVVIAEDERFFSHSGVDFLGIARAGIGNILAGELVQGGSTITQQLVKLKLGIPTRNLVNKVEEILTAVRVDHLYSKEDILETYLNNLYFGRSIYGLGTAARYFFRKSVAELSLTEAAFIASLISRPLAAATADVARIRPAHRRVLRDAAAFGLMAPEDVATSIERFYQDYSFPHGTDIESLGPGAAVYSADHYLSAHALSEVHRTIGREVLYSKSVQLETTFLLSLQREVQAQIDDYLTDQRLEDLDNPTPPPIQAAAVILTRGGQIVALVGGSRIYGIDYYNRATESRRRVASAIKPFIYAASFEAFGYTPDTVMVDEPVTAPDTGPGIFSPSNHYVGYLGEVTLRRALAQSINTISLKLTIALGIDRVYEVLQPFFPGQNPPSTDIAGRAGPGYRIAIGDVQFSLMELTRAYLAFTNAGAVPPTSSIQAIMIDGEAAPFERSQAVQAVSRSSAELVYGALESVFAPDGTSYTEETLRLRFDPAGKSGSLADNSWFVGFVPGHVIGIWLGYDDPGAVPDMGPRYSAGELFVPLVEALVRAGELDPRYIHQRSAH